MTKKKIDIKEFYDTFPFFDLEIYKRENPSIQFPHPVDYYHHFFHYGKEANLIHHNENLHLYNIYHLGDNVFNIIFFNKIYPYLSKKNIVIQYYCNHNYHSQVKEFIQYPDRIKLRSLEERGDKGLELWINNRNLVNNYELQCLVGFDTYYIHFYNYILKQLQFPIILFDLKYKDEDLLYRKKRILSEYPKYKNLDILFINSEPLSGQYPYPRQEWNQFITTMNKKYNIITTLKVKDIDCTMDIKLTIKDIAALSIEAKYIIAINTGPFVGCYNEYTLQHVNKIYIFVQNLTFDHPKVQRHIHINDLYSFF